MCRISRIHDRFAGKNTSGSESNEEYIILYNRSKRNISKQVKVKHKREEEEEEEEEEGEEGENV